MSSATCSRGSSRDYERAEFKLGRRHLKSQISAQTRRRRGLTRILNTVRAPVCPCAFVDGSSGRFARDILHNILFQYVGVQFPRWICHEKKNFVNIWRENRNENSNIIPRPRGKCRQIKKTRLRYALQKIFIMNVENMNTA